MMFECGLRPIGAYAYAPVGRRKEKKKTEFRMRKAECEMWKKKEDRGSRFRIWDPFDFGFGIWDFGFK